MKISWLRCNTFKVCSSVWYKRPDSGLNLPSHCSPVP